MLKKTKKYLKKSCFVVQYVLLLIFRFIFQTFKPYYMLITITITLSILVLINLLLLKFSCNKVTKPKHNIKETVVLKPNVTTQAEAEELAPTGS